MKFKDLINETKVIRTEKVSGKKIDIEKNGNVFLVIIDGKKDNEFNNIKDAEKYLDKIVKFGI